MNPTPLHRRDFVKRTTLFSFGLAAAPLLARAQATKSPGEKLVVGVVGLGRGFDHVKALQQIANVEVAYLSDIDETRIAKAQKAAFATADQPPKAAKDFRRILDDKEVDAIFIATPNHWHAPAAILGCSAGKHVYVEKPGSHNAREGELLVAAARKNNRVVQMQTQHVQRVASDLRLYEAEFAAATPDYQDAATHYVESRKTELKMLHPQLGDEQLTYAITHEVLNAANQAMAAGRNPAELLYSAARHRGYTGRAPTPWRIPISSCRIANSPRTSLVAVQPVYMHPYSVAKMIATLPRSSAVRRDARLCLEDVMATLALPVAGPGRDWPTNAWRRLTVGGGRGRRRKRSLPAG